MFLRAVAELERSFGAAESRLLAAPRSWLPGLVDEATAHALRVLGHAGLDAARAALGVSATFSVGDAIRGRSLTRLPLHWQAQQSGAILAWTDGDLELAALGADCAELAMSADFEPIALADAPAAERDLCRRVAELALARFVTAVASQLGGGES